MFPGQILLCTAVIFICVDKPMTPFKKAALILAVFAVILVICSNVLGVE